jgi:hypothetical protein
MSVFCYLIFLLPVRVSKKILFEFCAVLIVYFLAFPLSSAYIRFDRVLMKANVNKEMVKILSVGEFYVIQSD